MTFIASIITQQGIVMSADSKEIINGGEILWEDFAEILDSKNISDMSDEPVISPKEISEKFEKRDRIIEGRIKSFDGAKKLI